MSDTSGGQYESFAHAFEAHALDSAYNAYYDRPALFSLLGDVTGKRVLDAGCGPGLYADELVARGAIVTAFDASEEMVRRAQSRLQGRAEVRLCALGEPLTWLGDDSQDLVLMALVLHHLDDRVSALRELHRVLRPAGRMVLSTTHPTSDWQRLGGSYFTEELVEETWQDDWRVSYWRQPLHRWCDEFVQSGFVIERLAEPRPVPEMAERYPDEYGRLNVEPGFIAFRLAKAAPAL